MSPSPANFWGKSQPFMNTSSPLQLELIPSDDNLILDSEIFPWLGQLQSIQHSRDDELIPDSKVEEASQMKVLALKCNLDMVCITSPTATPSCHGQYFLKIFTTDFPSHHRWTSLTGKSSHSAQGNSWDCQMKKYSLGERNAASVK